ncbi:MAG: hypothetical protein O4804_01000 [Trichodesmium sp. St11_bin5]|nr:hypothetical protein [Trichodesmium sp. St11_bin5]MDT9341864.1 hypothetical protein [Trichodesmium erythraeum 21-75]
MKTRNHRGRRDDSKTPIVVEVVGIFIVAPGTPAMSRIVVPATATELWFVSPVIILP